MKITRLRKGCMSPSVLSEDSNLKSLCHEAIWEQGGEAVAEE
jgi:hypothetical protein